MESFENLFNHSRLQKRLRVKKQRGAVVVVAVTVEAAKRLITQGRSERVSTALKWSAFTLFSYYMERENRKMCGVRCKSFTLHEGEQPSA